MVYSFSIHRPGEEVQWSLALEQVWWPISFLHNFGVQFIPFKLGKLKKDYWKGKKNRTKSVHKACFLRVQIMTLKKWLKEIFWANILFKFKWFSYRLYIKLFHMLKTFYLSILFKCCFKNTCFQEVKLKGVLIFKQVSPLICNLHQGSSKCLWTCSSLLKLVSI